MNQNSFIYTSNKSLEFYLQKAGGLTQKADSDNIYIVHANGEAQKYETGYLFHSDTDIKKGDTVVVPVKIEVTSNLQIAKDVSSVLYQLAVTAASLSTLGAL